MPRSSSCMTAVSGPSRADDRSRRSTNRLLTARSMRSSVVTGRGHGEPSSRGIDLLAAVADRDGEVVGLAAGHLFGLLVLELADLDSLWVVERVNERQVVAGVVGPIVELDEAG